MKYGINTIDDFNLKEKTVLARLDLNSPFDSTGLSLADTTRIDAALPTIEELQAKGAKLVILTHQGGDLEHHNFKPTSIHAKHIEDSLNLPVKYIDDVCGPEARKTIKNLSAGDIIMLDNVRYMAEEMTLFETKLKLSPAEQTKTIVVRKLAPLADVYICDAFAAAHRSQPTLVGFPQLLPSGMGRLFEKEYGILSEIINSPKKPCVFLLGGSKIEDAFSMMPKALSEGIADNILAAGLLAQVFYLSEGLDLGKASIEIIRAKKLDEYIDKAQGILKKYRDRIILPKDFSYIDNKRMEIDLSELPAKLPIVDIGSKSIHIFKEKLSNAATVFINGPAGVFEKEESEIGTKKLWNYIASHDSFSVIGGGDSIAAANKYGISDKFSYVCTGGGAMVRFLSGEELPVVKALKEAAIKFK